jgi:putative ABC transport system ATP-binding protein
MILLELVNVSKLYAAPGRAVVALDDVTLQIKTSEFTLLIGPSGSGKTTMLSIMGCLLRPTQGTVYIGGQDTRLFGERQLPRLRAEYFGYVFQNHLLFRALTAVENVELALQMKFGGYPQARDEAVRLLSQVGLVARLHHKPAALSGGERQRVAIARALAGSPLFLLADEPTAALDTENALAVARFLQQMAHDERRAVVVVSHDLRLREFADRVLRVDSGRVFSEP